MRVCVTGGRDFNDLGFVWSHLDTFHNLPKAMGGEGPITELGQGEARGVDKLCKAWAKANGVPTKDYEADWARYGDEAGTIRNGEMLDDFKPERLLVFPGGDGTKNCAKQARKKKILRTYFNLTDDPFEDALNWG